MDAPLSTLRRRLSHFGYLRLFLVFILFAIVGIAIVHLFTTGDKALGINTTITRFRSEGLKPGAVDNWRKRVIFQLINVPEAAKLEAQKQKPRLKSVVLWDDRMDEQTPEGQQRFKEINCAVDLCSFTRNRSPETLEAADAILFRHEFTRPTHQRPPEQMWIVYLLESPWHSPDLSMMHDSVNWTATYRLDSTIPAPYAMYLPYNMTGKPQKHDVAKRNFAKGKTKKVAMVVSNCQAKNNRLEYAVELGKYIDVDIYGKCGKGDCKIVNSSDTDCHKMIRQDYKFYLSFENSNCREYITEKFFRNGLGNDALPIAMGAHPDDYKRSAPPHSYLHVDNFTSPKQLAQYLKKLDENDDLYNSYFKWKDDGEIDYNWHFYCRFCTMLWDNTPLTWYSDLNSFWRKLGTCTGEYTWKRNGQIQF